MSTAWRVPIVLGVWLGFTTGLWADDWPTYRRDYFRGGVTAEAFEPSKLKQDWVHVADQAPRPAWPGPARWDAFAAVHDLRSMRNYDPVFHPIVVDNSVYFGSSADDSLYCLDAATGKARWSFTTGGPIRIAPTWVENQLYFGSDDGHAYCLAADTGKLVWKFSPTAGQRLVIHDGRLISFAPVRTGVVVADGTAYFGASLMPWKKSYLCALDAKTGKAEGAGRYVHELNGQTMEGNLLLSERKLIVPQGRVAPLLYDRVEGKPQGPLQGGTGGCFVLLTEDGQVVQGPGNRKGQLTAGQILVAKPKAKIKVASFQRGNSVAVRGDTAWVLDDHTVTAVNRKTLAQTWRINVPHACEMLLAGDVLFVGGRDAVFAYRAGDGQILWRQPVHGRAHGLAAANGRLLVSTDEGHIHCFATQEKAEPATPPTAEPAVQKQATGQPPAPKADALQLAEGPVLRFVSPDKAVVRWKSQKPVPTLVEFGDGASPRLLEDATPKTDHEVTFDALRKERIYQYRIAGNGAGQKLWTDWLECDTHLNFTKPAFVPAQSPFPKDAGTAYYTAAAEQILTGIESRQGMCVILGLTNGRLAYELAARSQFQILAVDDDPARVEKLRRLFQSAKLHGTRISILPVERWDNLPLPPRFANLVVSERYLEEDKLPFPASAMYRLVQPIGGVAVLGKPASMTRKVDRNGMDAWLGEQKTRAQWGEGGGQWVRLTCPALPGAGEWTHMYGRPDNSAFGGEQLGGVTKTADLEVQWFGQPGPRLNVDRQPRKPAPLACNGRLFVQGFRRVLAMDAFNGTILWSLELPRLCRFNVPHDSSNWCADDKHLYLAVDNQCWVVDAGTGTVDKVLRLPEVLTPEQAGDSDWGYVARSGGLLIGSTVKHGSAFVDFWTQKAWYDDKAGQRYVCSDRLFARAPGDGSTRWSYEGGAILNATITLADAKVYFVESKNPALGKNLSGRLGNELWKDLRLVALDLATGREVWAKPLATLPGSAAYYLAHGSDRLVLTASDKGQFGVYLFDPKDGAAVWNKTLRWEADHHGKHVSRPAVVGKHLIVRPWVLDLDTGRELPKAFPKGHGCGSYAAAQGLLILRALEVVLWDLEKNADTRFTRLRPDCWISTIPANGMLLSPEGGGGCSCGNWMEMSVGFLPAGVK